MLSLTLALPNPNPAEDGGFFDMLGDKLSDAVSKNVDQICIGTGGGLGVDSCPKPFQYCDTRAIMSTRCRYTAGTWFLMVGVPLIVIGAVVGGVYYMKKRLVFAITIF